MDYAWNLQVEPEILSNNDNQQAENSGSDLIIK